MMETMPLEVLSSFIRLSQIPPPPSQKGTQNINQYFFEKKNLGK